MNARIIIPAVLFGLLAAVPAAADFVPAAADFVPATADFVPATADFVEGTDSPVELGRVKWLEDLDAALELSASSGRPVLLLFQEIPG
jgi:hypothetical protein